MNVPSKPIQSVYWFNEKLHILDQTKLPTVTEFLEIDNINDAWEAIKELRVRGANAIGIAVGYSLVLGIQAVEKTSFAAFWAELKRASDYLASSRPTAVNLFWALKRMEKCAQQNKDKPVAEIIQILLQEAHDIRNEDEKVCRTIGEKALTLFEDGMGILTHCNAGGIATARYGTALAPIYLAKEKGWNIRVYADETRPLLQGARLTAWELMKAGVDVTLITDNMAAHVMSQGLVDAVIVGCDRVAANGDVANKIGTYGVAILAKEHHIPFYVAAPLAAIDLDTKSGSEIPIELRKPEEVTEGMGKQTAPTGVKVYNPAFDVTPHEYIKAIITEKGIIYPPFADGLAKLFLP